MSTKSVETRMTLKDQVTPALGRINKGTLEYKKNLRELKSVASDTWSGIKTGATALAATLGVATAGVIGLGFKTNASMEQAAMSFDILLGSADKAKQMMSDLQKLAVDSPFEFEGLQKSAKTLLGMGFSADKIIPTMNSLGEAVAATGGNTEQLEGIALAFGQINAKGKLSAEEANQLAERGIPIWQILAKQMGKPTAEIMKMSEQGKLLASDTIPMITKGLNERFGGSMDKLSNTWNFMIANIKESLTLTFADISFPLFQTIKNDLKSIRDRIAEMKKDGSLQEWGNKASTALSGIYNAAKLAGSAILSIGGYVVNNWNYISPIVYGVVGAFTVYNLILIGAKAYTMAMTVATYAQTVAQIGLNAAIRANPMGWLIGLIGLLIAAGTYLIQNWQQVKLWGMLTWNVIVDAAQWAVNKYFEFANFMAKVYKFAFDSIEYAGKSIWNGIISAGQAGVNGFISLVDSMINRALSGINTLISGANKVSKSLGLGTVMDELSFGGLGRVDFSGAKFNAEKPKWDSDFNPLPKVNFSGAKFSEDSIMAQKNKAQAERDKNKQKQDEENNKALADNTKALTDNTNATTNNTSATSNNTAALEEAKSAEDIADSLYGRINRLVYGTV